MIELHSRRYRLPTRATVVICADGCDPAYIVAGIAAGVLPTIARWRRGGFYALADAVMPTFTNPNNLSIVTGAPPSVHGISGNFALDRETGAEIMMTDPEMVRGDTILGADVRGRRRRRRDHRQGQVPTDARQGRRHRPRRRLLLVEQADRCTLAEHGIADVEALVGRPKPDMYSADLSLFVLDAGIRLVEEGKAQLLYLSLSDYVQHGHAPDEAEALEFHRALDDRLARLEELGCVVALTADHGMNDKALPDGTPHVVFLEDVLNARFGAGAVRVICPITDPFVRHHGALGSFVRVYRKHELPLSELAAAARALSGIDRVFTRDAAAAEYELPYDREADLVVTGDRNTVIGASAAEHDLSALAGHRLRSHGGACEQTVPFLLSRPLARLPRAAAPAQFRHLRLRAQRDDQLISSFSQNVIAVNPVAARIGPSRRPWLTPQLYAAGDVAGRGGGEENWPWNSAPSSSSATACARPDRRRRTRRSRPNWPARAWFAAHHSVFPSTTRASAASIATGCLPARHGLLGNTMALDEGEGLVCRSAGHPDFPDRMRRATGRTLQVPTLAERLRRRARPSISCANVSPGAAYFQDPDGHGYVYHAAGSYGPGRRPVDDPASAALKKGAGRRPRDDRALLRRNPRGASPVAGDPVAVGARLHRAPLACSARPNTVPRSPAPMPACGRCSTTVRRLDQSGDDILFIAGSDHGMETVADAIDLDGLLIAAGLKEAAGLARCRRRAERHCRDALFRRTQKRSGAAGGAVPRRRELGRRGVRRRASRGSVGLPAHTAMRVAVTLGRATTAINPHGVAAIARSCLIRPTARARSASANMAASAPTSSNSVPDDRGRRLCARGRGASRPH